MLSRRIHSIFVLRLFNDCWAVMFCYLSLLIFSFNKQTREENNFNFVPKNIETRNNNNNNNNENENRNKKTKDILRSKSIKFEAIDKFDITIKNINLSNKWWYLGSILYSFAVSIKMNILLYCPAIGLVYYKYLGFFGTLIQVIICIVVQLIIGLPFLIKYPISYISRAFNLGKDFEYKWTVNFKFIDEKLFLNKQFGFVLLLVTVLVMLSAAQTIWCKLSITN